MKTRQEMIYDFMVALASNGGLYSTWNKVGMEIDPVDFSEYVMEYAKDLADEMIKGL